MSQRVRMPTTWAVRCALGFAALLAFALVGVASAESIDAPAAVVQPPGMAPLLQATTTPTTMPSTAAIPAAAANPALAATPAAAGAAAATAAPAATVTIREFEFSPSRLEISVGDTVIWANSGQQTHTATSANGVWDTGNLRPGESAYFTFTQPGMYAYSCTIHPRMRGTISVSPAGMGQAGASSMPGPMSSSMQGNFDNGWSQGYGYSGMNPMGPYGQSSMSYYYNPINGNYYAGSYLGYPYNMGYGAWWGGQYGYGYPFSYMGGYGYPGYASSTYPYSSYGSYYPYSYYGGYSPYSSYGSYYPYSYYPYSYMSAYSPLGYNSYYPYGSISPYSSLYYSYYRYPYYNAYGYYPYQSYGYFAPYYANSYSSLLQYSYLASIYGYQVPYYGSYYGYPSYSPFTYGLPYTTYPFSPYIY